jgi:hypothetical protein
MLLILSPNAAVEWTGSNSASALVIDLTLPCNMFCSRIFLAGKKVMQIALGRSPADEAKTGLHKLSKVRPVPFQNLVGTAFPINMTF